MFAAVRGRAGDLPHQVFAILGDDVGFLWMSSNAGVFRVPRSALDAVAEGRRDRIDSIRYGHRDGMVSSQCNGSSQPAGWKTSDGRLWFATAGGAVSVDPTHADVGAVQPPPIVVERVTVDGEAPAQAHDFDVAPDSRRITFEYAALAYRRPEHVNYRFRLVGYDSDWVAVGPRRSTVFTNLPPGDYQFQVEPDEEFPGFEKLSASVGFRVLPHLYENPWFLAALALSIAALAYLVFKLRVMRLVRRKVELERQVAERTQALGEETRKLHAANEQTAELLLKVRDQAEAFERLSREDALTGLPNRRHFDDWLRGEFDRCRHEQRPISVAVFDLDDFKRVNDAHSHAVGDEVLRTLAHQMRAASGGLGMPARFGGDEFVIGFPGVTGAVAASCCERLRQAMADYEWNRISPELTVTVTIGVSDRADATSHERLIAFADEKLYEAKKAGRNRVAV
jgi:diguanylate cyclase (GGDEF)-like protein